MHSPAHLSYEDPDEPEPTGDAGHDEVEEERSKSVALLTTYDYDV